MGDKRGLCRVQSIDGSMLEKDELRCAERCVAGDVAGRARGRVRAGWHAVGVIVFSLIFKGLGRWLNCVYVRIYLYRNVAN